MIVIIGGGPAGLAVARLLHQRGLPARVLERDSGPHARTQGGSLDLTADKGLRAIEAMGLTEQFAAHSRPEGQQFRVLDRDATTLVEVGRAEMGTPRPEIDRVQFRQLLLDSLPAGTVEWDTHVRSITPTATGHRIEIANGDPIEADLVIACDGIGSKARRLVTDDRPYYAGVTFIQGHITAPDETSFAARATGDGALFAIGDNRALMTQRNGDRSIRVYVALRLPDDPRHSRGADLPDERTLRADLADRFAGWSPDLLSILDDIDGGFQWWPLYSLPAEQHWTEHHGLTLVGDAAHIVPPFTGQGVNMALLDAVELVDELAAEPVEKAIANYESAMLSRMRTAITDALAAQNRMITTHGPTPLLNSLGVTA